MEITTIVALIAFVGFRLRLKSLRTAQDSRFGSATRAAVQEYEGLKGGYRKWKSQS